MMTIEVDGHGIVAIDEDDENAAYSAARILTSSAPATDSPGTVGDIRVMVEVLRRHGGIAPRALLGAQFVVSDDATTTLIEVEVASFDLIDSDEQQTIASRLWTRPFTSGLPSDMADAVLDGLTADARVQLPPGVLRVDRAGFDVMNSSEAIFAKTASLLGIAISAKLSGRDPEPILRAAIQDW